MPFVMCGLNGKVAPKGVADRISNTIFFRYFCVLKKEDKKVHEEHQKFLHHCTH